MRDPLELISAYFDDLLAPGELEQLADWLRADPDHKREFVRASMLHSRARDLLHEREVRSLFAEPEAAEYAEYWVHPGHVASLLDEEAAAEEKRAREAELAEKRAKEAAARRQELLLDRSLQSDPSVQQPSWTYAVAASLLAVALFTGWRALSHEARHVEPVVAQRKVAPAPTGPAFIGVVTRVLQADTGAEEESVRQGVRLVAGPLNLTTGVVEVELATGARLIVEAPAKLELLSADRVQLDRGRLVAHVPPQAVGFTLRSKAASFVDLGTEFGVQVGDSGEADIHVLDGEVALVPGNRATEQPSRTLLKGQANSVSADGSTVAEIPFDASRFLRQVPASAYQLAVMRSRPLASWRLNEWSDAAPLVSEGSVRLPAKVNPGVKLATSEIAGGPKTAAKFNGSHDGIDVGVDAALGLVSNCTCEAWVLPSAGANGPQRIYSSFDRPRAGMAIGIVNGAWYQLEDNELKLQLTLYGVYDCVGSIPVEADRWVHLAATVGADAKPSLYVNGKPAQLRFRQVTTGPEGQKIDHWSSDLVPPPGLASAGIARLGRNPVGADGAVSPELWQGMINSVAVYNRVLTAKEIKEHADLAHQPTAASDKSAKKQDPATAKPSAPEPAA